MPASRFSQRGHAGYPSALEESRKPRRSRTVERLSPRLAMVGACITALAVLGWINLDQHREPVNAAMAAALPTPSPASNYPQAPAGAQERADPLSAGLMPVRLDGPGLTRLEPLVGQAEARLIRIYQHIRDGQHRQALQQAEHLTRDHPNFQLAQLVLGDLLSVQARPVRTLGDVPDTKALAARDQLEALREESRRRIRALTERPPAEHIPQQFLALAPSSRHAIAIDASRSRLYLFENLATERDQALAAPRLRLIGDYYISVGLLGIEKYVEGDKRTPLGVYYITSTLDPKRLPDLYGVGALPINYPNALDVQRGKTGSGIWLHGTPSDQFVRAPQASDGCVVLSNQDLDRLLRTVQIRTTPVVIAPELTWVKPQALDAERQDFAAALGAWREAKSLGDATRLRSLYSERFRHAGRSLEQWWPGVASGLHKAGPVELKDTSLLQWHDQEATMVVTFGEVPEGRSRGITRRQYWARENGQWRIFYEGST